MSEELTIINKRIEPIIRLIEKITNLKRTNLFNHAFKN